MTRNTFLPRLAALLVLAGALGLGARPAAALEFGFQGSLGNLNFPWSQETPTAGNFPADNYVWGGSAFVGLPLSDDASLRLTYELDPILRNVLAATVQFERGIARISVGPYCGFLNSASDPFNLGLSTSIRFQWPGIAYASVRSDGAIAIGSLADALGAEPQTRAEIAAGFYTRNAIISGVISASSFSYTDAGGLVITDALSSYLLTIDLFKKNVPYTLRADLGYEVRSKYFAASSTTDAVGGIVLGIDAEVSAMPGVKILASFKSQVFVFGLDNLVGKSPSQDNLFFDASLGLAFDTEALGRHLKATGAFEKKAPPDAPPPEAPAADSATDGAEEPLPPPLQAPADASAPRGPALLAGLGLYYNFVPLSSSAFAFLEALYNLRGGAWVDVDFPLSKGLTIGGEAGLEYISSSLDGGTTWVNIFDLPLRATAGYQLGPLGLKAFAGLLVSGVVGTSFSLDLGLDAGLRLSLGSLYVEGSYVLGLTGGGGYPRAGLGFTLSPDQLFGKKP